MVLLDSLKALSANLCKQIAAGLFLRQKMKTSSNVLLEVENGAPRLTRTDDLPLTRRLLYQLSY